MDTGRGVSSQEASSSSSYERTSGLASAVHTCTPTQLAVALATSLLPSFVKGGKRDARGMCHSRSCVRILGGVISHT
jgi:hypothetical protein